MTGRHRQSCQVALADFFGYAPTVTLSFSPTGEGQADDALLSSSHEPPVRPWSWGVEAQGRGAWGARGCEEVARGDGLLESPWVAGVSVATLAGIVGFLLMSDAS
jgi:hypothetical protein